MTLLKQIRNSEDTIDSELHDFQSLKEFYLELNKEKAFEIKSVSINDLTDWKFDEKNNFVHNSGRFFSIKKIKFNGEESGILLQNEIGTLGLVSCVINDVLYFLIQFKKEPGNIVSAQLSPTLQATLSNQNQVHGGRSPRFLELFTDIEENNYLTNEPLPEQGYRYWRKFNLNSIVLDKYFKETDEFKWMTLGQIYKFSEIDNSINSCLRSVLSLINNLGSKKIKKNTETIINKYKQKFQNKSSLGDSVNKFLNSDKNELLFQTNLDKFHIKGISINIEGREVKNWNQPIVYDPYLEEYMQIIIKDEENIYMLLKAHSEPGYEFGFTFGPTSIIKSKKGKVESQNLIEQFSKHGKVELIKKIQMSEEGARFFHTCVDHTFYEIQTPIEKLELEDFEIFSLQEVNEINSQRLLSMEGRSILFFLNTIYNNY
tara:strand:- start:1707 stop:2996 length:1290 start_codon:yes stop_codon:yes gene_type:complete